MKNIEQNNINSNNNGDLQMTDSVIKDILDSNTENTKIILNEFNRVYDRMDSDKKELSDKIDSLRICMSKNESDQRNRCDAQNKTCDNKYSTIKNFYWTIGIVLASISGIIGLIIKLHVG